MVINVHGRTETTEFQHEGSTETDNVLAMPLQLDLSWSGPTLGFFWCNTGTHICVGLVFLVYSNVRARTSRP
jgi:hypothetical protein